MSKGRVILKNRPSLLASNTVISALYSRHTRDLFKFQSTHEMRTSNIMEKFTKLYSLSFAIRSPRLNQIQKKDNDLSDGYTISGHWSAKSAPGASSNPKTDPDQARAFSSSKSTVHVLYFVLVQWISKPVSVFPMKSFSL